MKRSEFKSKHDPSDEVRHLRATVSELEGKLESKRVASGQVSEAMDLVLSEVETFTPTKPAPIRVSSGKVSSPVTHCVHATDWHIGQRTNPNHVEEFGAFNLQLAEARIAKFAERVIHQTEVMRGSYNVDTCHILGTADWISGDIHDELIRTAEVPAPVQAVRAGYLLGGFAYQLSAHFERVVVDAMTAGNHDRITRKPQCEDGGLNSWGYVACAIAEQHCRNLKNVKWNTHCGLSKVVNVCGQRYLISHGDGIMGTWGIPFYGIERRKQREATARMNMPESAHFDKIVIGHFHTALNHEHWMIGGSLSGTTAYDHKEGRHSNPHQTSWFIHPSRGEFAFTRWWL